MQIHDAQKEVRSVFLGGSVEQVVGGWLTAAFLLIFSLIAWRIFSKELT